VPLGQLFPGTKVSDAASSPHRWATFRLVSASRGIRLATARPRSRRSWHLLGLSQRQRVEPARQRHAVLSSQRLWLRDIPHQHLQCRVPKHGSGGGIFPYTYTPSAPKFYPSQSIEASPQHLKIRRLPVQPQRAAAIASQDQRDGSLCRYAWPSPVILPRRQLRALLACKLFRWPISRRSQHFSGKQEQRRQYDAGINLTPGTLSGITYLISDQTSNYNGLQISATKAMSRGFSVSGFYVWSRALESSNPVENGGMTAQDPACSASLHPD